MTPDYLQRLFDDYTFFIEELWKDRGLDKHAPIGDVERDIFEHVANGPRRRGVLAPRGRGKTTWGTAGYTCWRLFRDPDTRIVIVSKTDGFARKIVSMIRGWISHVAFLKHLEPRAETAERIWRDNVSSFDVGPSKLDKQPSVTAIGVGGQLPGNRAHLIIGDDVETPENTKTLDAREELSEAVKEFPNVASYGDREVLYFGTYHHEESLYIKLAGRGYAFFTWPLLCPTPDDEILNLAPWVQNQIATGQIKPGEPLFNVDSEYVADMKAEGRIKFAMQQMLIANMGDATLYPLRLRDLIVFPVDRDRAPIHIAWGMDNDKAGTRIQDIQCFGFTGDALYGPITRDKEWAPYARTVMWIDPAKGTERGDKIGYAVVGQCIGHLYVKACGGIAGRSTGDHLEELVRIARRHGATEIHVEDYGLQNFFGNLLEPVVNRLRVEKGKEDDEGRTHPDGWSASVELTKPKMPASQKELRIIGALDPILSAHRLVIDRDVIDNEALQHQLTRITRQRDALEHDDEIESLANAVAIFGDNLRSDPHRLAERRREQLIQDELDAFYRGQDTDRTAGMVQPRPAEPRWFTHH